MFWGDQMSPLHVSGGPLHVTNPVCDLNSMLNPLLNVQLNYNDTTHQYTS